VKGVGARFQPRTVASIQSMIFWLFTGCCPFNARATRMRWIDSVSPYYCTSFD